jgi:hypothetical protein
VLQVLGQHFDEVVSLERGLPGQEEVGDSAELVDVAAGIEIFRALERP